MLLFDLKSKIYFMAYEKLMGRPHPSLKQHHLRKIDEEQVRDFPRNRLKSPTPFVEMRSSKEGSVQSGSLSPKGMIVCNIS